ncbi:hypothetical protein ACFP1Z_25265 [Streptomyces gamaensis]|uniref:Uncharacterized protein n=1 Tax=Streptomyces gamaensis TaxID=1763542 RepID=A0ABW0Z3U3_9ACTN
MRALITVLAILAILVPLAGMRLSKSQKQLPKWYFLVLIAVVLALVIAVVFGQLT